MQRVISTFFHRMGVVLSFFTFIALLVVTANNSVDVFGPDILIPSAGCIFIYSMARFAGWIINCLIDK